ncbi:HNH endonuclease [Shewanella canadensis]|uniref:HNH endonuclease n=1 Tax=Shewanella canadensis TaxID=271096 RepID=A0A3S0RXR7_9GAMM|nr:HNH endonuclease [Shewanella canadensis]RTR38780.1 HNH endonuclease [Shewanella canadensis]
MNSAAFSQVDAAKQVEFIAYLQRLLVEGDFVATYKFALLHALADICIERPQFASNEPESGVITIDELVEKFIELYWQHSLPYTSAAKVVSTSGIGGTVDTPFILLQNAGKQSALIKNLAEYRNQGVRTLAQLKMHPDWNKLLSKTRSTFKEGPLWRLQLLAGSEECFYYPHDKTQKHVVLNPGIAFCFRRFHDLAVSLARSHWTQKVCDFPLNHAVIGGQGNLSEFLFGSDRNSIIKARPVLHDIQKGKCFYCNKPLKETGEVDHFIPWARYPNDLGHNFVLAHSKCNKSKSDHLAAEQHKERWFEQNIIQNTKTLTTELANYFVCESGRSEAIATWAYQLAVQNQSPLWLKGKSFETYGQTDKGHFV